MARTKTKKIDINKMAILAILSAIVVVLQVICTFVKFGPFSITLALTPIIIGGALYGIGAGAYLGTVFGIVVLVTGFFGWDGGTVLFLFSQNAIATILLCLVKGAAAGAAAGLVYKLLSGKSRFLAVIVASLVCPIVNTSLFVIGMTVFFLPELQAWASGWAADKGMPPVPLWYYIIFGLLTVNFPVEIISNLLLSSETNRIIKVREDQ